MVILKEREKKQEIYIPLEKFGDRIIDIKSFFDGVNANFKQELSLSFYDSRNESLIVTGGRTDVKINTNGIIIQNRNTGMIYELCFNILDLSAINEVANVSSTDYVFYLKKYKRVFYRVKIR
jgi:hypothetical protein